MRLKISLIKKFHTNCIIKKTNQLKIQDKKLQINFKNEESYRCEIDERNLKDLKFVKHT